MVTPRGISVADDVQIPNQVFVPRLDRSVKDRNGDAGDEQRGSKKRRNAAVPPRRRAEEPRRRRGRQGREAEREERHRRHEIVAGQLRAHGYRQRGAQRDAEKEHRRRPLRPACPSPEHPEHTAHDRHSRRDAQPEMANRASGSPLISRSPRSEGRTWSWTYSVSAFREGSYAASATRSGANSAEERRRHDGQSRAIGPAPQKRRKGTASGKKPTGPLIRTAATTRAAAASDQAAARSEDRVGPRERA